MNRTPWNCDKLPPSSPLVVIVGPTAVGKTLKSIQLAERLNGEIVSADSRLFYRGMDIGTAKPSASDLSRVRHHLLDVADPDQTWSITVFQRSAKEAIADIHSRGKLPFLVGGSGQYIHSVTKGWMPPPVKPNYEMRTVLENLAKSKSPEWLHEKLTFLDPYAAEKIDPRNVRRTIRALEVILTSGQRFSELKGQSPSPFDLVQIGLLLSRTVLYRRIDARIDGMFEQGLLREVKALLAKGYSADLPTMSAIGYRESVKILEGSLTEDEAKIQMRKSTRIFVRRQANWFKENDNTIKWFDAETEVDLIAEYIKECLTNFECSAQD
jgi:tRNA dimethylallyltransferase